MVEDSILKSISDDISEGRTEGLPQRILSICESEDDPMEILKCMSLLKLLPSSDAETKIAMRLRELADDVNGFTIASALQNLDCPLFAIEVLDKIKKSDRNTRLKCSCLYDLEEYESAFDLYGKIENKCVNDRILLSRIQSALGEHTMSVQTSAELLSEYPKDYDVRVAYANSMMMAGHDKELLKYAREGLKDKSADSLAVAAYIFRILGKTNAAGNYAAQAIKADNSHIGAMETLGICLAMKGEYQKAKITAGAINEISPGNKAVINILAYCDGH